MHSIDADYCYTRFYVVRLCVCASVTLVSPAKTAEQIKMPFGMWARVGPSNHALDVGTDPSGEGKNLRWGRGRPIVKCRETPVGVLTPAKMFWRRCGFLSKFFDLLFCVQAVCNGCAGLWVDLWNHVSCRRLSWSPITGQEVHHPVLSLQRTAFKTGYVTLLHVSAMLLCVFVTRQFMNILVVNMWQ